MLGSAPLGGAPLAGAQSASTYSLAAATGSFVIGPAGETLADDRTLAGSSGSVALAGSAAGLLKPTYSISTQPGTFAYAGYSASVVADRQLPAASGGLAFTGKTANAARGQSFVVQPGVFGLRGGAAQVLDGYFVNVQPGGFALGGPGGAGRITRAVAAVAGAFSTAGHSAKVGASRKSPEASATVAIAGRSAAMSIGFSSTANAPAIGIRGGAVVLGVRRSVAAQPGSFTLAGSALAELVSHELFGRQGVFSILAGAGLARGRVAGVSPWQVGWVGSAATAAVRRSLVAATGTLVTAGQVDQPAADRGVRAAPGGWALAGHAATMRLNTGPLQAAAGTIALAGKPAGFGRQLALVATSGAVGLRGQGCDVEWSAVPAALARLEFGPRWRLVTSIEISGDNAVTGGT